MVERYESLRRTVMQRDADHRDVRGVALLMRRGVAAWMCTVGDARVTTAAHDTTRSTGTSCATGCSSTLEQMLVNIVAAMALVHAKEVFA